MKTTRRTFLGGATGTVATLALPGCARDMETADVVVIGAGISGLHTARLLEKAGASVVVLEGTSRVGGRIETLFDLPGAPEIGAADIGTIYYRMLGVVEELGLEAEQWPSMTPSYWYHFNGEGFTAKQWPEVAANTLEGKLRNIAPSGMGQYFIPQPLPLPTIDAWSAEESAKLDVPYGQYLRDQGASPEALKLIMTGWQYDELDEISALWHLRLLKWGMYGMEQAFESGAPLRYYLKGGMSRLTDAMAASLANEVRLDHWVTGIEQDDSGVTVSCRNGSKVRARYVICTVPLTILRNIAIEPALPQLLAEAVNEIPYGMGTSVLLHIASPYWEKDGQPPNFWTDLPMVETAFVNPSPIGGEDHLWVFTTGRLDASRGNLSEDEIFQATIKELARVRPATEGALEPLALRSWTRDPFTLGTYASRAPGQPHRFADVFNQPSGRLVIAGEHACVRHVGLEGAMESAELSANAVAALL
ncbi:MAG: NAD(P)/FAD-dependent oxidoreductase [Gammaproteobacteria bacterium]|nr:NAD(P)/FAD-dependent oxidoreductase [Gammaproteobacteria bacterium]